MMSSEKTASSSPMQETKLERADALASDMTRRAWEKARGNRQKAMEILWSWSRQNSALQAALIRLAIEIMVDECDEG